MDLSRESVRVLHVDDNANVADTTAALLEHEDDRLCVETTTSVETAIERLSAEQFDCIVSDYDMPGQTGIEFLEAVRDRHPEHPFILYTGKGSEEIASDAISAGVTDYLQKGSDTERYALLANRIHNAVDAHRSQRKLDERTRRLESLISSLPGMVYRCLNTSGWPMETVEGEIEPLTGYTAADFETGAVTWGEDVLHPEDRDRMWEAVQEALAADGEFEVTYRIITADGTTKWMWERGHRVPRAADDPAALEGFITDVTDLREREQELRRYERMVNTMQESACIYDREGRFEVVNQHLASFYGTTRAELEGESSQLVPKIRSEHEGDPYQELIDGDRDELRGVVSGEFSGHGYEVLEYRLTPLEVDGQVTGVVAVTREVTEQRARETELAKQRSILKAQQEAVIDGILVADESRSITWYNDRFIDMWDIPQDIVERGDEAAVLEWAVEQLAEPEAVRAAVESLYDNPEMTSRDEIELADGRVFDRYTAPVVGEDGTHFGRLWTFRDITERKERERELARQNERLEEFVNVVSHDLRSPLQVAGSRLMLAQEECDSEHLESIDNAVRRMNDIVDDVLKLAREGVDIGETEPLDLRETADAAWRIAADNADDAELRYVADEKRNWTIEADSDRLSGLFENLLGNATEHAGPSVTVSVGHLDDRPGFYVADDGPGIPADERERVLEPGYSTADDGTGFGLRIAKQIAEAHGWEIRVTDSEDGGARFEIIGVDFLE
ncbi:PAS domain S-box protein [Haloarcula sp. CBA1130]|uniref:hybrid sensor histidine kinase/response regulator n=1 Tax=unclassified Haloarcula TaxID=2624677 RepID=UPI0012454042|nr:MULTISPECIES: PAS domain S-box protein [unclassified Haloarcula]KAA9399156.1 PAS domain S-box protein [Haloarcula sp. CBA1129]KAA9403669.1 PAS domain S-box protein [Haloarcula sp. CBA1130]